MKWVTIQHAGAWRAGLVEETEVALLPPGLLQSWLGDLNAAKAMAQKGERIPLRPDLLAQPILRPGKILGIGLNYAEHAKESVSFVKNDAPQVQKWFNKQSTAAHAPYAPVDLPSVSEQLDYEAELVVIIGKTGRHVPAHRAMEMVAGFACGCDFSVRDWQKASPTMIMGKGFDTHAPFGPYLVTPEEVGDYKSLEIKGFVNGELRQHARAADMTFDVATQIAHLTAAFTLEPGDVIFTGTPAGVGAGFTPPKWLKAGDKVLVEIPGIGRIQHEIIAETGQTRLV